MLDLQELTGTERVVRAVLDHRIVRFRYHGQDRTVEPHVVGIHEAGEPMLVAYQTGGGSNTGELPGWRTFITTSIENVEVGDEHFESRGEMAVATHAMIEVFARA